MDDDFGFGGNVTTPSTTTTAEETTNLETGEVGIEGKTNLDNNGNTEVIEENDTDANKTETSPTGEVEESPLSEGDSIELDGVTYTVDATGNLVNEKGEVFKTKDEVADFLKNYTTEEANNTSEINMEEVQKLVGVDVVDDKGNAIVFENTPQGVSNYINSVLELKQEEYAQAGINKLVTDFPILNDFLNYYIANGYSYEGFGQLKDRSGIQIDDNNEAQQIAIIREAWKEFGRKGSVDKYITYLKDSGQLLDVAKDDLAALQQADEEVRRHNSEEAARVQEEEQKQVEAYWKGVKACVDKREIAGYKIPETIIIKKDGKQITCNPDDFFKYVYQVDDNGLTQYQKELANEAPNDRMQDELLKAWLKFTGKSYNSLVEMAVAEKEAKKLRLTANKNKTAKATIKITKAAQKVNNLNDENFGY